MPLYDLKDTDLAYIAGIIDGEGCIAAGMRSPNKRRREITPGISLAVAVVMTDESLICWLHTVTGLGRIYHYPGRSPQHRDTWHWNLSVRHGSALLEAVKPYLKLKKAQAELFLEIAALRSAKGRGRAKHKPERQFAIVGEIKSLNSRGR